MEKNTIEIENDQMKFRFPLQDVKLIQTNEFKTLENALNLEEGIFANQQAFQLTDELTGSFQVLEGREIRIKQAENARMEEVELVLNGSLYGALLHQRQIISFHAGSFAYRNLGIVICGESEVGKSTTTLAFCLEGADFLTDETTPIVFNDHQAAIWGLSDRLKIWDDALISLNLSTKSLQKISEQDEKYFYELSPERQNVPLSFIFLLEICDQENLKYEILEGLEKFEALSNQIYRKEYLPAMPETEKSFFIQVANLTRQIPLIRISRPKIIHPHELRKYIAELISIL